MKHAAPFVEDAVTDLAQRDHDPIVGVALAPHWSVSVAEYHERAEKTGRAGHRLPGGGAARPGRVDLVPGRGVREALESDDRPVLFSAHSLPERVLRGGDPYPPLLEASAKAIAAEAELASDRWQVAWQSAGTLSRGAGRTCATSCAAWRTRARKRWSSVLRVHPGQPGAAPRPRRPGPRRGRRANLASPAPGRSTTIPRSWRRSPSGSRPRVTPGESLADALRRRRGHHGWPRPTRRPPGDAARRDHPPGGERPPRREAGDRIGGRGHRRSGRLPRPRPKRSSCARSWASPTSWRRRSRARPTSVGRRLAPGPGGDRPGCSCGRGTGGVGPARRRRARPGPGIRPSTAAAAWGRDPSVGRFACSIAGPAAAARMVDPLVGAINAGDPNRLSLRGGDPAAGRGGGWRRSGSCDAPGAACRRRSRGAGVPRP